MSKREFQDNLADMTALQTASPMSAMRSAFGRSHLPHEEVSFIHKLARFNDNLELLGQQSGNIESRVEKGFKLARSVTEATDAVRERSRRSFNTIMFLSMLDQHIAQLEFDLEQTRDYFGDKYGESWREELALDLLDEDEMPQREDGESLADYRERVERAIVEKVSDEDGNLKPEYQNHPDAEHLGRLAKQTRDLDRAQTLRDQAREIQADPDLTEQEVAEQTEELLESSGLNELSSFQETFEVGSTQDIAANTVKDSNRDEVTVGLNAQTDDNSFLL